MEVQGTKNQVVPVGYSGGDASQQPEHMTRYQQQRQQKKAPEVVLGKKFPTYKYTDFVARYPTCSLCVSLTVPFLIILIAFVRETTIDTRLEGFQIQDHSTVDARETYRDLQETWNNLVAESETGITEEMKKQQENIVQGFGGNNVARLTPVARMYIQMEVDIEAAREYYKEELNSGGDINELTNMFLRQFQDGMKLYEAKIQAADYYTQLCFTNSLKHGELNPGLRPSCVPPVSLSTYFYPGIIEYNSLLQSVEVPWDGRGAIYQDLSDTINRLLLNSNYKWFTGPGVDKDYPRTVRMRSQITLGGPLYGANGEPMSTGDWQFLVQLFVESAEAGLKKVLSPEFIKVTWGGDMWVDSLARATLDRQYWIAPVACLLSYVLFWLHCRSMVISACALVQLLVTYLTTFSLFAVRSNELPLLSSMALFVAIAFGADGTMTYYDTFNHSGFMATTGRQNMLRIEQRIAYTFRKAYGGIALSNFIAFCCFAANTVSPFPAVREFARMCMVLVVVNMVLFASMTPSYLLFHHFYFSKRRRNLQRQKEIILRKQKDRAADGLSGRHLVFDNFLTKVEEGKRINQEQTYKDLKEDEELTEELKRLHEELHANSRHLAGGLTQAQQAIRSALEAKENTVDTSEIKDSDFAEANEVFGGGKGKKNNNSQVVGNQSADTNNNTRGSTTGGGAGQDGDQEMTEFSPTNGDSGTEQHRRVGDALYMGDRLVPPSSIIHIAPLLLMKNANLASDVQNLLMEVTQHMKTEAADAEQKNKDDSQQQPTPPDPRSEAGDGDGDGESSVVKKAAGGGKKSIGQFRDSDDEVDAFAEPKDDSPTVPPPHQREGDDLEEMEAAFETRTSKPKKKKRDSFLDNQVNDEMETAGNDTLFVPNIRSALGIETFPRNPDLWEQWSLKWYNMATGMQLTLSCELPLAPINVIAYSICCCLDPGLACVTEDRPVHPLARRGVTGGVTLPPGESTTFSEANETASPSPSRAAFGSPKSPQKQSVAFSVGGSVAASSASAGQPPRVVNVHKGVFGGGPEKKKEKKKWRSPSEWWEDRGKIKRRWCFGRFGKRVGETRAEKDARILGKRVKHEGYGPLERALNNRYAPFIHWMRYSLVILFFICFIVSCVLTSLLQPANSFLNLVEDYEMAEPFAQAQERFVVEGGCDYCSAYYRPRDEYRVLSAALLETCSNQGINNQVGVYVDKCGVCDGSNSCADCAGTVSGGFAFDSCGVCAAAQGENYGGCTKCNHPSLDYNYGCNFCQRLGLATSGLYGAECDGAIRCSPAVCDIVGGRCNPVTGVCECWQDFEHGYFKTEVGDSVNCSRCAFGFTALSADPNDRCRRECSASSTGCPDCQVDIGRCFCPLGKVGPDCADDDLAFCNFDHALQHIDSTNLQCVCKPEWDDHSGGSGRCAGNEQCSWRGVYYTKGVDGSPFTGCHCNGHWAGPDCSWCKCRNGGACNVDGTCTCVGAWQGDSCDICPSSCQTQGACPTPWRPNQYDITTCIAIYCGVQDQNFNRSCTYCSRALLSAECSSAGTLDALRTESENCGSLNSCYWNSTSQLCFSRDPIEAIDETENRVCHQCKGAWGGSSCSQCFAPTEGLECVAGSGLLKGCDNRTHEVGDFNFKVVDQCGVCGGANECVGCDGVRDSGKVFDSCGICGGTCDDSSSYQGLAAVDITWMWGIDISRTVAGQGGELTTGASNRFEQSSVVLTPNTNDDDDDDEEEEERQTVWQSKFVRDTVFDLSLTSVQEALNTSCWELRANSGILGTVRECIFADFTSWIIDPSTAALYNLPYPYFPIPASGTIPTVHKLLYDFARANGRLEEVVFNHNIRDSITTPLEVIAIIARSQWVPEQRNPTQVVSDLEKVEDFAKGLQTRFGLEVSQSAPQWVEAVSKVVAITTIVYPVAIGMIMVFVVLLSVTCSASVTFVGWLNILGVVLAVLGILYIGKVDLGPIEQIGVSLILGFSVEHTVQLIEGYLDALHASQSHMFAQETTSLDALKQGLVRTGRACLLSSVTVVVLSLLFTVSDITAISRSAVIILIINVVSVVWTFIFLTSGLAAFGPASIFRHWTFMFVIFLSVSMLMGLIVLAIYVAGGFPGPIPGTRILDSRSE